MGESGLKIRTQLVNNIHAVKSSPQISLKFTVTVLKKKPKATKCSSHHTISHITHTAKTVARLLRRSIERKTENVIGQDQFGFRRGKETRAAAGMLRVIQQRTLEIDKGLCACFIDWQKAFDHVKWTKLVQIIKETGVDWHERRLISKLYMVQIVKVQLDQGETRNVKTGRRVKQECCLSPVLFNLCSEYLTSEVLERFGDFRTGEDKEFAL
jgi:hypothetical protein